MRVFNSRITSLALAGLLALAMVPAEASKIYKWVDEKGVTHYGEKAPEGTKAATVKVSDTTSSDAEDELMRLDTSRSASEAEKLKAAEKATLEKMKTLPDDERERTKVLCERHRKNLQDLKSGGRLKARDEAGNSRYLTDEELAERIRYTESEIQRCEQFEQVSGAGAQAR